MASFIRSFYRTTCNKSVCDEFERCASTHARLYQILSLGIGLPSVVYLTVKNFVWKTEEQSTDNDDEYIPYEYLNIRTKRFPWGDGNTPLFYNPCTNTIPATQADIENAIPESEYLAKAAKEKGGEESQAKCECS